MSNWEELERYTEKLVEPDSGKRAPLSGATKGEEDIIGRSLVCQCKFTDNRNTSILEKDLARLLHSAKILHKFPVFVTESKSGKMVSIPIMPETEDMIKLMLEFVSTRNSLAQLRESLKSVRSPNTYWAARRIARKLGDTVSKLTSSLTEELEAIKETLSAIYDDLTTINLFEYSNESKSE